jgi:hypothetical protein
MAERLVVSPNLFPFPIHLNQHGRTKVVARSVPGQIVHRRGQVYIQRKPGVGGEFCRTYCSLWAAFAMSLEGEGAGRA